jgi:hypothetical protein
LGTNITLFSLKTQKNNEKLEEIMGEFPLFFKFSDSVVVSYCECRCGQQTKRNDYWRYEYYEVSWEDVKCSIKAIQGVINKNTICSVFYEFAMINALLRYTKANA